jgi:ElaA protein
MTTRPLATSVHRAYTADLDADQLYRLLRLRVQVFVIEQQCPYQELDGRDLERGTRHFWIDPTGDRVLAYLRLLEDPGGTLRISRVCTALDARGTGLASKLMRTVIAEIQRRPSVLSAQAPTVEFYRSFGYTEVGQEYLEDGIPHIDMRRDHVGGA